MSLPRTLHVTQVRQDWQRTMDTALEAGQPALLEWGTSRRQLNHLSSLLAYQVWNTNRGDVTQPVMLTGNIDAAWPTPLLIPSPFPVSVTGAADGPPMVQFVYGGADQSTYLASMTTQATQRVAAGAFYTVALPVAMQPLLAPITQPHAHATWQSLPLTLLFATRSNVIGTIPPPRLPATPPISQQVRPATATPIDDPWLAWIALVMIIALVLLALFV